MTMTVGTVENRADPRLTAYSKRLYEAAMAGWEDYRAARADAPAGFSPADVEATGGVTLLHAACTGRDARVVRDLIAWGVDVNRADERGSLPLHIACSRNTRTAEAVEVLVAAGASINAQDVNGNTAVHFAVGYTGEGDAQLAKLRVLLSAGAALALTNNRGEGALTAAERSGAPHAFEAARLIREAQAEGSIHGRAADDESAAA